MHKKLFNFKYILLNLAIVFSIRCYDATFFNSDIMKYLHLTVLSFVFMLSVPYLKSSNIGLDREIRLIVYSMFISIPVALYTWGQGITDSFIALLPLLPFAFYFYLNRNGFEIAKVENVVLTYGLIYVILYFFQLTNYETVYFGYNREYTFSRGVIRIIFPGGGFFFLSSFIALCRLQVDRARRPLWLLIVSSSILVTVLQATRQLIAALLIVYVYHFLLNRSFATRLIAICITCTILLSPLAAVFTTENRIVKELTFDVSRDVNQGDEYIRIMSAKHYLSEFSPNIVNSILGNGAPRWSVGPLGTEVENLQRLFGYYMEDIGILGFYTMFGIVPVIAFILIMYKILSMRTDDSYRYVKYYAIFLIVTCLTSDYLFQNTYLMANVIWLFIANQLLASDTGSLQDYRV